MDAVLREDGHLANTLGELIQAGNYGDQEKRAFTELCDWLVALPLIVRDLTVNNIVWDEKNGYFVIIDGVGGRLGLSLRSFLTIYNKRSTKLKVEKLKRRISKIIEVV